MACRLCEGYQMKVAFLQQNGRDLKDKIKEIERINNTLLVTLHNCQPSQNWKVQCERLLAQNHALKTQLNMIKKSSKQGYFMRPNTPSSKKNIVQTNYSNSKAFYSYLTPRSQAKTRSSQKMSNFITSMKKNQLHKMGFIKTPFSSQSKLQNQAQIGTPIKLFAKNKEAIEQRKNAHLSIKNYGKRQKVAQFFESSKQKVKNKGQRKTLIEILASE